MIKHILFVFNDQAGTGNKLIVTATENLITFSIGEGGYAVSLELLSEDVEELKNIINLAKGHRV